MARFCSGCGKEIPDGIAFCTGCGTKAPDAASTVATAVNPQPVQPAPVVTTPSTVTEKKAEVSTGYFFGMMFLYALPVIGWLVCLITAFAGKGSKKNFARAILIWAIIGIILSIITAVLFSWLGGMFVTYLNEANGGELTNLIRTIE